MTPGEQAAYTILVFLQMTLSDSRIAAFGVVALAALLAFRYQTRGRVLEMQFSALEKLTALHVRAHQAGADVLAAETSHRQWAGLPDTNPEKSSNFTRVSAEREQRIKELEECLESLIATIPVTSTLFSEATQSAWVRIVELHASMKPSIPGAYCIWKQLDVRAGQIPSEWLGLLALLSEEIRLPSKGGPARSTVSYHTPSDAVLEVSEPRGTSGTCEHGYVSRTVVK